MQILGKLFNPNLNSLKWKQNRTYLLRLVCVLSDVCVKLDSSVWSIQASVHNVSATLFLFGSHCCIFLLLVFLALRERIIKTLFTVRVTKVKSKA